MQSVFGEKMEFGLWFVVVLILRVIFGIFELKLIFVIEIEILALFYVSGFHFGL